jgi:hypothetical protein
VKAIDEDNLAFLTEVIARHGWLGSALVGEDGASACWLMVQHTLDYETIASVWTPEQLREHGRSGDDADG